jgi:tetratricopeptide (TPR) repeat protein
VHFATFLRTRGLLLVLAATLAPGPSAPSPAQDAIAEAERLAEEAVRMGQRDPRAALVQARRALVLTNEFNPTAFVEMGRKGEVVEDEFKAARTAYGEHRAVLYSAVGTLLVQQGDALAGSRYLSRAFLLDPRPSRGLDLARAQIALGRGREALDTIRRAIAAMASLSPEAVQVIVQAVDVARLPSAQAEIDRGRLKASLGDAVTLRDGQVSLPPDVELSSTPVFRLEEAPVNLIYMAEASCRHCSADLSDLHRLVPDDVRILILPEGDDQDAPVRQVLALYRYPWPLLLGRNLAALLELEPRSALVVARGGWSAVELKAPFGPTLTTALTALSRTDVQETVPRPLWNRRPADRSPLPPPPGLLEDGLAPGEDRPFPPEFEAAVEAYRAGRHREALEGFDALEARGDGWLLPPEARLNRALCLAGMGKRGDARRILLRTGDSRFEEAIDETLERVAGPR